MNPRVQVIGAYRVPVDDELIQQAMDIKYPRGLDSDSARRKAQRAVLAELSSVVLLEVVVQGVDERFDASDFNQPGSDQAAYMESYLSEDGGSIVSEEEQPPGECLRIAFYIHFFDSTLPFMTSYGKVDVPEPGIMPLRLSKILRYEPVD